MVWAHTKTTHAPYFALLRKPTPIYYYYIVCSGVVLWYMVCYMLHGWYMWNMGGGVTFGKYVDLPTVERAGA